MARLTKQERREAELRRMMLLGMARTLEFKFERDRGVRDCLMNVAGQLPKSPDEWAFAEKVYQDAIKHLRELAADDGGRS